MSFLTGNGQPAGRKFAAMAIGCGMLLAGVAMFHFLGIDFEHYGKFVTGVGTVTVGYGALNVMNKRVTNGFHNNGGSNSTEEGEEEP
jgi:hypothetical protein